MAYIEKRLRDDLGNYDLGIKPSEYAPKIYKSYLTKFLLTAKNKSQGAIRVGSTYEKVKSQTVVLENDEIIQKENLDIMISFIRLLFSEFKQEENSIDANYVWNNIPFDIICDNLLSKMHFYSNDRFFSNILEFIEWMKSYKNNLNWDVIVENTDYMNMDGEEVITISNHNIKKVNRAKRPRNDVIDLGTLRNPKDEKNACYYENKKIGELTDVKKPKLFLYIINGQSKAREKNTVKKDLNLNTDLAGIYMYVPNTDKRDKDRTIVSLN